MKKGFCGVFLTLFLCIALVTPVFAEPGLPRLIDEAELLSAGEEAALLSQLDEVSERQEVDIVVVTANSLSGASAREYADDFYDDNGYGFGEDRDGILFLISMKEREWYISTRGYGITAVTDAGLEYMSEQFLGDLSEGSYASAFTTFVRLCDDFITQARTDMPYQTGRLPKEPFEVFGSLVTALAVGFVVALVVTGLMRTQLKTVHRQSMAGNYIETGSMRLTREKDLFLYRNIVRTKKVKDPPKSSSATHTSSSGARHGGGGGRF